MLDVALIRREPDRVRRGLEAKGEVADIDWFLQLDKDFRKVVTELEKMRARQNALSPEIGRKKRSGEDASAELPPTIYLFQRNLERYAADRDHLREEIRTTLFHELGHLLGLDEDEVDGVLVVPQSRTAPLGVP